jgi:membrane-associated phospholipid phosphatase
VQAVLAAPGLRRMERRASAAEAVRTVRAPEWIVFAFLLYAPVLAVFWPAPEGLGTRLAILNAAVILIYASLIFLDHPKLRLMLEIIRDWLPLGIILLAYREMGWFALPHHVSSLESQWVAWDRVVFSQGGRALVESLGPVLPSVLEIAYALVYALPPFALAILYLSGRREAAGRFLTVVLLGVLLCYAQFPFWPSDPPRVVFAGMDLPSYNTIFRRFNLWMLGNYGIHTSVFPSAHVAGALSTAFGLRRALPGSKRVFRSFFVIAILIAIATVYGRYHYLADATYGAVIACIVPFLIPVSTPKRDPQRAVARRILSPSVR